MAIRKVAIMGNPILRRVAEEVPPERIGSPEVQRIIDDLVETMHEYDGAGIAAPQIHESKQICVIEVHDNPRYPDFPTIPLTVLVNPKITFQTDQTMDIWEGCLSVPDVRGKVPRCRKIDVQAFDRHGKPVHLAIEDVFAGIVQHETDHLFGVLFVDRVKDTKTLSFLREFNRYVKAPSAD